MTSTQPTPPLSLKGYRLLLGKRQFSFPRGNKHTRYRNPFRFCHSYCTETALFTEMQSHNAPDIYDGTGFSTWRLGFLTPASGVAVLLAQDVMGPYRLGEQLPFRIEPLK